MIDIRLYKEDNVKFRTVLRAHVLTWVAGLRVSPSGPALIAFKLFVTQHPAGGGAGKKGPLAPDDALY